MRRCPKCGRYMNNYVKQIFGGASLIYACPCGYKSEESSTGMVFSDKTTKTTAGDPYSRIYIALWAAQKYRRQRRMEEKRSGNMCARMICKEIGSGRTQRKIIWKILG